MALRTCSQRARLKVSPGETTTVGTLKDVQDAMRAGADIHVSRAARSSGRSAACHEAGFNPTFGEEAPRLASALTLVAAGLGVILLPASLQNVRVTGVVYRPLKAKTKPHSVLSLVTRRNDRSTVVRNFTSFCRRSAGREFDQLGQGSVDAEAV